MDFGQFQQWAFLAVITGGVYFLREMSRNIASLNEKIAVLVLDHEGSKVKINDHEDRIRTLEKH